jgi:histidyl-tRNA synthetase
MQKWETISADKHYSFAVIAGEQEMATNSFSLKNLATGDQMLVNFEGTQRRFCLKVNQKKSFV